MQRLFDVKDPVLIKVCCIDLMESVAEFLTGYPIAFRTLALASR